MLRILPLLLLSGTFAVAADSHRVDLALPAPSGAAWQVSRASVDSVEGLTLPTLVATPQAARRGSTLAGAVSVSFDISPQGIPFSIQVDKASDKELEDEVIAMIREWRFEAARRDGIPIVLHGYMDFELQNPRFAGPRPKAARKRY